MCLETLITHLYLESRGETTRLSEPEVDWLRLWPSGGSMSLDRFRRLKEREAPEPEPKPVLWKLEIFIAPVASNKSCLGLLGNV